MDKNTHARRRAGEARAAQPSAQAARRKGGATRAAQLRGDRAWGAMMAERRRLKRRGPPPTTSRRLDSLEAELRALQERVEEHIGAEQEVA